MATHPVIFHIDVNSAYLSWSAVHRLQQGHDLDLRTVPSVVGGNELSRHGIVLAKSLPAKKFKIQTGEPLRDAFTKCPGLISVPPNYNLYMKASTAMLSMIKEYAVKVQQFSIDECFVDYTHMEVHFGEPLEAAQTIKERIKEELGFTVNIGISSNKILAKMASDFSKPNQYHTLYPNEIEEKMWPLPVGDLFMVGRQTERKLRHLGIETIGQLAGANTNMLVSHFKSHGLLIQSYARGIDQSPVRPSNREVVKGIGNSTTVPFDVESTEEAYKVLLSLCESVAMRLRGIKLCAQLISVSIVTRTFEVSSHQRKLYLATDSTTYIYMIAKELFNELWDGEPIRKLGVRISELNCNDYLQLSLLENYPFEKHKAIDASMDAIRSRYGNQSIFRASFLHSGLSPITGGIGEEEYPLMTSIL